MLPKQENLVQTPTLRCVDILANAVKVTLGPKRPAMW